MIFSEYDTLVFLLYLADNFLETNAIKFLNNGVHEVPISLYTSQIYCRLHNNWVVKWAPKVDKLCDIHYLKWFFSWQY